MTEKLKPCPFCGGYVHLDEAYSYFRDFVLYCEGCDMVFTLDSICATKKDLIEAWNQRAEPENRPLTLEELRAHCAKGRDAEPLWAEFREECAISRWIFAVIPPDVFDRPVLSEWIATDRSEKYGKEWRCWPRKPTPEQMAAEKWEE